MVTDRPVPERHVRNVRRERFGARKLCRLVPRPAYPRRRRAIAWVMPKHVDKVAFGQVPEMAPDAPHPTEQQARPSTARSRRPLPSSDHLKTN